MTSPKRNKHYTGLLTLLLVPMLLSAQSNFSTKTAKVSFFSSTPVEDIKAASGKGVAVLMSRSRDVAFQIPIKSFEFDKGLMQEHFNENYMESDKYPYARFKGRINQDIDFTKDGEYNVTVTGPLLIHGVEKTRTINGKLKISGGTLNIVSAFNVACADHNIKIPTLIVTKVAEVINVKIDANLTRNK